MIEAELSICLDNELYGEKLMLPLRNCPVVGAEKGKFIFEAFTSLILGRGDAFTKRISCLTCITANLSVSIGF